MKHAKQQKLTVKNVWGSMLMQVSGLGVEIATAIAIVAAIVSKASVSAMARRASFLGVMRADP